MDPASGSLTSGPSRLKKPLHNSFQPLVKQESSAPSTSADLGGTLVPQDPGELADLSTDSDDEDAGSSAPGAKRRKGKSKYNLPRRQIKIEYIQDKSRRNITFGKRKHGIFKKAQELSTLTGCEVMLIVAPKDNDHQAYTFATRKPVSKSLPTSPYQHLSLFNPAKLRPMVTESAGEAYTYIQNCLRYGALMPGAPSGITGPYGSGSLNIQGSIMSTLNMGPRGSPATLHGPPSHAPLYSYGSTASMIRRAPPASYGLPHPLSSPQSTSPASVNPPPPHSSLPVSHKPKRPSSTSPLQHVGANNPNTSSKVTWQGGGQASVAEFHSVSSEIGTNSGAVRPSTDLITDWNAPNPRNLYHQSPSLTSASAQSRAGSSFGMTNGSVAGIPYHNISTATPPFHRQSPDGSILAPSAWQGLPSSASSVRAAPSTPGTTNLNPSNNNGSSFLTPLVLSRPYDHHNTSPDGPISAGPINCATNQSVNMQPSLSQYGEHEHYESLCPPSAYLNDDGSDLENGVYNLDASDQQWPHSMH